MPELLHPILVDVGLPKFRSDEVSEKRKSKVLEGKDLKNRTAALF